MWSLVSAVCLFYLAGVQAEVAYLRSINIPQTKRNYDDGVPTFLQFQLHHTGGQTNLNLEKNQRLNADADVYAGELSRLGNVQAVKSRNYSPDKTYGFYQDQGSGGYFLMQCQATADDPCLPTLKGNLLIGGEEHSLQPTDDAEMKRGMTSFLGIPHTLEILEKQNIKSSVADDFVTSQHSDIQTADDSQTDEQLKADLMEELLEAAEELEIQSRKKRSTVNYGIELLVVVDYPLYFKFESVYGATAAEREVVKYMSHIVNGADFRFSSIQETDMSFYVTIAGFYIATSQEVSPWTGKPNKLRTTKLALKKLEYWFYSTSGLPQHDHVTLVTGNDLVGQGSSSVAGVAFQDGMCGELSMSIIEDKGFFKGAGILAHEIGHSLGANHDGAVRGCEARNNYIMAPFVPDPSPESTSSNYWTFSSCSIQYFRRTIQRLDRNSKNCLLNEGRYWDESEWSSLVPSLAGQLYTPLQQCRLLQGATSSNCPNAESSNICRNLRCSSSGTCANDVTSYVAAPGTPCGDGMWCVNGLCVARD